MNYKDTADMILEHKESSLFAKLDRTACYIQTMVDEAKRSPIE